MEDKRTKCWYLVHTKPRQERVAEKNLQRQNFEVYFPLAKQLRRQRGRWRDIIEPLFPRYLFVRLRLGFDNISPIRYTTGVHDLVRFSDEPAVVPSEIVDSLIRTADCHTGLHSPKIPLFELGDKVVVDKGPLAGLRGIFVAETGQERVIILLNMLGRENRISLNRDALSLALA